MILGFGDRRLCDNEVCPFMKERIESRIKSLYNKFSSSGLNGSVDGIGFW